MTQNTDSVIAHLHEGTRLQITQGDIVTVVELNSVITFQHRGTDYILQAIEGIPPGSTKKLLFIKARVIPLTKEEEAMFSAYITANKNPDEEKIKQIRKWLEEHS